MGEQFEKVPTALARDKTMSLAARAVYPILLAEAWERGARADEQVELPPIRDLAVIAGCSMTALKGYLRELSDAGWVWTTRAARGRSQRYVIRASRGSESDPQAARCGPESDPRVGRKTTHSRARDPLTDELHQTGEHEAPPAGVRVGGRNLPVDALCESCGVDSRNRTKMRELTAALRDIRQYVWDDLDAETRAAMYAASDTFERRLAATIRDRAAIYRRTRRKWELTAPALAKWWHDLVADRRVGMTDDERQMLDDIPNLGS